MALQELCLLERFDLASLELLKKPHSAFRLSFFEDFRGSCPSSRASGGFFRALAWDLGSRASRKRLYEKLEEHILSSFPKPESQPESELAAFLPKIALPHCWT